MKIYKYISLILLLPLAVMTGCSSGGDSVAASPNAPAALALATTQAMIVANSADTATLKATVTKADGTPVPDGTPVTFSVPAGSGTLSAATATTTGGVASVTMTRGPVSGAKNQVVTVTCTSGGATAAKDVKCINQPTSAAVSVAMKRNVSGMAALDLKLKNTAGATFDNAAQKVGCVNAGAGSLVAANFAGNVNTISMINANGVNTGTAPIMTVTHDVIGGGGLPKFTVDAAAGAIAATDANGAALIPPVTADDIVVTTVFDTE